MSDADASAKLILFGEHAVVYGRPALAIPLPSLRAHAKVQVHEDAIEGRIEIVSIDLHRQLWLHESDPKDPLAAIVRLTLAELDLPPGPPLLITIRSDIPIGAGLGSGAAVSVAVARALAAYAGVDLHPSSASRLALEVERIHHGSPSGIDNTVIAYERPVYYIRGQELQPFDFRAPLRLALADTGERIKTSEAVAGVRSRRDQDPARFESIFDQIARITEKAHASLLAGDHEVLGPFMNENHELLRSIGVSTSSLDRLVRAAREAGAQGAKLTGAGLGGYMVALVGDQGTARVMDALREAGAAGIIHIEVGA